MQLQLGDRVRIVPDYREIGSPDLYVVTLVSKDKSLYQLVADGPTPFLQSRPRRELVFVSSCSIQELLTSHNPKIRRVGLRLNALERCKELLMASELLYQGEVIVADNPNIDSGLYRAYNSGKSSKMVLVHNKTPSKIYLISFEEWAALKAVKDDMLTSPIVSLEWTDQE